FVLPSTNFGKEMEARLQTATSSGAVYSIISVQRLLDFIVPRFFWFDFSLQASLYKIYGVPVSICDSRIANHKSCAFMVFLALPSSSYLWYRASNSLPYVSGRPGASFGQKSDHVPFSLTLCIKRSGIHNA